MQIHELNTRVTQATDWLALDTNSQTYKAKTGQLRPEFTSHDASNPTNWDDMAVISSSTNITTFFERLSYAVKNLRYLWKLIGSSSFSNVASTISGAIGNTALPTTATSLSGAIAEHEGDISNINDDISTINGNLTQTSETTQHITAGSGIQINGATVIYNKYVLMMRVQCSKTDGTVFSTGRADSNPLFTINSAIAPRFPLTFPVVTNNIVGGGMSNYADAYIASSGNVIVDVPTTNTTAKQIQVNVTYMR